MVSITKKFYRLPSLFLLLSITLLFSQERIKGKVISITDGDTIDLLINNYSMRVRLEGIDCPESGQAFGTKAKQVTSDHCFGDSVYLEVHGKDRYNRTLGTVILESGVNLNRFLVLNGFARWYCQYSSDEILQRLEEEARLMKRGLWADSSPIPPWEFRRGNIVSESESQYPLPLSNKEINPTEQNKVPAPDVDDIVYITKTGSKYHKDGCRYLSKSKISILLTNAQGKYTPCSKCFSRGMLQTLPQLDGSSIPKSTSMKTIAVYVTRTGAKYHKSGCRYLSRSQIPISLSDAKLSYTPCSVCNPPR